MDKNTIDNVPYLAGVIGHPISHSKSPRLTQLLAIKIQN